MGIIDEAHAVEVRLIALDKNLDAVHAKLDTLKLASSIILSAIIAAFAVGLWL